MARRMSPEVVRYYRAALMHYKDARVLLRERRSNGAMYLAGYVVECALKALLVSTVAEPDQIGLSNSFRGRQWHDFDHLRKALRGKQVLMPDSVNRQFARINSWSTDIRYDPRRVKRRDAEAVLTAAEEILNWAKGRF